MRPLSATECISPAIARTRLVLFTPFRKGRTWKLSATAYLCRIGTIFFPFPLIYLFLLPAARSAGPIAIAALLIGVFLLTAVMVLIFYLCSRLQFAYFDIVANRGEFVAPAWRKYGRQSVPWTGVKVLAGTLVTLACGVPMAAFVRHILPLFHTFANLAPGEQPSPQMMGAIFEGYGIFYGILLLVYGPFFLVSSLLSDFLVPSLALEDTGLGEAFRRMAALVRNEPGEFALYTLLKCVLAIASYIGATIAWEIVFIVGTLILVLIAWAVGFLLQMAGVPHLILIALAVLVGIVWYMFAGFYSLFLVLGPVVTFIDAYALYFLGGRYPMLGDLLDRSTPPPTYPYSYPLPYSPASPPLSPPPGP